MEVDSGKKIVKILSNFLKSSSLTPWGYCYGRQAAG